MIPPERYERTPADLFDAWLREADTREAARPRSARSTWPQRMVTIVLGLALCGGILAGLAAITVRVAVSQPHATATGSSLTWVV